MGDFYDKSDALITNYVDFYGYSCYIYNIKMYFCPFSRILSVLDFQGTQPKKFSKINGFVVGEIAGLIMEQ